MSIVNVSNVKKVYGTNTVINNMNLSIKKGEIFGILGPNGAGKTTLIEMIMGLRSYSGNIQVNEKEVRDNLEKIKKEIGISLQSTSLFPSMTVMDILSYFAILYGVPNFKKRIEDLIYYFDLSPLKKRRITDLSGGERQRLILSLAMVHNPNILFLDEPTTGLDPNNRNKVWNYIKKIHEEGKTIVLTTHFMDEAQHVCTNLAFISNGKIYAKGDHRTLISKSGIESKFILTGIQSDQNIMERLKTLESCVKAYESFEGIVVLFNKENADDILHNVITEHELESKVKVIKSAPTLDDLFITYTGGGID